MKGRCSRVGESLRCIVPAAGEGARLRPNSLDTQKPLMLMGASNRRLIDCALDIASIADETFVTTPFIKQQADLLEEYVSKRDHVHTLRDPHRLGAASLVYFSEELFEADSEGASLILPADHVLEGLSIEAFHRQHLEKALGITTLTVPNKPYGQFIHQEDNVVSDILVTSTDTSKSSAGVYIVQNRLLLEWAAQEKSNGWQGEPRSFLRDVLVPLIDRRQVATYDLPDDGYWDDAGTIGRYYYNNMRISNGSNVVSKEADIDPGATISQSIILGSVVIPVGATIHREIISGDTAAQHVTQVKDYATEFQ